MDTKLMVFDVMPTPLTLSYQIQLWLETEVVQCLSTFLHSDGTCKSCPTSSPSWLSFVMQCNILCNFFKFYLLIDGYMFLFSVLWMPNPKRLSKKRLTERSKVELLLL